MAPIDRREHRQQRVRGAGPSSVQASFGFNFGALGVQPAKQSSLPPQRSSRRTPVQSTPRGANGSAQRHRSASVQRSSSKRKSTPKSHAVTPQLGKRKRGSSRAHSVADDEEEDELSPDREELVRSIEKSRRVVGTVSPIREELDDMADELSILEEGGSTVQSSRVDASALANGTPVSVLAKKRISSGSTIHKTPIADRIGGMSITSRQSISRRSILNDLERTTPGMPSTGRPRLSSASRFGPEFNTPGVALPDEESEDELSPPQIHSTTPRIIANEQQSQRNAPREDEMNVDELSSPVQPTLDESSIVHNTDKTQKRTPPAVLPSAKRGRPKRIVEDGDGDSVTATPAVQPIQRGKLQRSIKSNATAKQVTPARRNLGNKRKKNAPVEEERVEETDEELDELSPETTRAQRPGTSTKHNKTRDDVSDAEDDLDEEEEREAEEDSANTPQVNQQRQSTENIQRVKPTYDKPPRKRQKFSGPKHAISVMRIKGSTVRGITVADTTRTILEETIDSRLKRFVEKLQTSSDSTQRKDLRSQLNLSLAFKESLNEKLLNLQDANDVLSTNFRKLKLFKRDNAELRREILTLQNDRQEIALEHDDVQAEFEAEKAQVETRNTLSANMFDIEAAIQNGREKARREKRESEGPEIPLTMLLDMVSKDVGSSNGGLLTNVKNLGGLLERAAGWLEGRA